MATLTEELLRQAEDIRENLAPEQRIPVAQARLYSRAVTTDWQTPPITWDQKWSSQSIQDILHLFRAGSIYADRALPEKSQTCYRRAGEILEWLARSQDTLCTTIPVKLLAGGAFQLGGQPAMAVGLLRGFSNKEGNSSLYAAFFTADFDEAVRLSIRFWKKNQSHITRGRTERILLNEKSYSVIERFLAVELVRCISLISASLRLDNVERINAALKKLLFIDNYLLRTMDMFTWMLTHLLRKTTDIYLHNSIYGSLDVIHDTVYPWVDQLFDKFARRQYTQGRGILWPSQVVSIRHLKADQSFALCTPTGSGKTMVAVVAILQSIFRERKTALESNLFLSPVVLYLVPSRALAVEVEAKFRSQLSGSNVLVTGIYGGTDWGITDIWLTFENSTILICTVEKAEAILRYLGDSLLSRISQIVIDEAHMVNIDRDERNIRSLFRHENRSARLEQLIERLMTARPSARRIALTAVAGTAEEDLTKWIAGRADASPLNSRHRSTRQLIGCLSIGNRVEIKIDLENGKPLSVGSKGEKLFIPLKLRTMPPLIAYISQSIYAIVDVGTLWVAMNLAESRRLSVLISISQEIQTSLGRMLKVMESTNWKKAELPSFFRVPRNAEAFSIYENCLKALADYCGKESFEYRMLTYGIAVHHGQLPSIARRLITELISRRVTPIVIATSTLTEGVNLPFDIILVPSIVRTFFQKAGRAGRHVQMPWSVSEFRNLAGRAGRPGAAKAIEGMTLVILPTKDMLVSEKYSRQHSAVIRQKNNQYKEMIKKLTNEGVSESHAYSPMATLMESMIEMLRTVYQRVDAKIIEWFETTSVETMAQIVYSKGGRLSLCQDMPSRLANGLDYLDGFIISLIEEFEGVRSSVNAPEALEGQIREIWRKSLAFIVCSQKVLLEQLFVSRTKGVVHRFYPNSAERKRLYRYGFTPNRGRQFSKLIPAFERCLMECKGYGALNEEGRIAQIIHLASLVEIDDFLGYGTDGKNEITKRLSENWKSVLRWWMNLPSDISPRPTELRDWLKFVADSFEFRLGAAIGAVLAEIWLREAQPGDVPRLDIWKERTKLPWFAFWIKELLRWGTIEPLTAFLLSNGMIVARNDGVRYMEIYKSWLAEQEFVSDEPMIDPRLFIRWATTLDAAPKFAGVNMTVSVSKVAESIGECKVQELCVLPISKKEKTKWIDPAGYFLAESENVNPSFLRDAHKHDYFLKPESSLVEMK